MGSKRDYFASAEKTIPFSQQTKPMVNKSSTDNSEMPHILDDVSKSRGSITPAEADTETDGFDFPSQYPTKARLEGMHDLNEENGFQQPPGNFLKVSTIITNITLVLNNLHINLSLR
jgi:hypothetical protein